MYSQPEGLATNSVEERERHNLVVRDLLPVLLLRLANLRAEFVLRFRQVAEQPEHARDRVRRRVDARNDERASARKTSEEKASATQSVHLRHLSHKLFVRQLVLARGH